MPLPSRHVPEVKGDLRARISAKKTTPPTTMWTEKRVKSLQDRVPKAIEMSPAAREEAEDRARAAKERAAKVKETRFQPYPTPRRQQGTSITSSTATSSSSSSSSSSRFVQGPGSTEQEIEVIDVDAETTTTTREVPPFQPRATSQRGGTTSSMTPTATTTSTSFGQDPGARRKEVEVIDVDAITDDDDDEDHHGQEEEEEEPRGMVAPDKEFAQVSADRRQPSQGVSSRDKAVAVVASSARVVPSGEVVRPVEVRGGQNIVVVVGESGRGHEQRGGTEAAPPRIDDDRARYLWEQARRFQNQERESRFVQNLMWQGKPRLQIQKEVQARRNQMWKDYVRGQLLRRNARPVQGGGGGGEARPANGTAAAADGGPYAAAATSSGFTAPAAPVPPKKTVLPPAPVVASSTERLLNLLKEKSRRSPAETRNWIMHMLSSSTVGEEIRFEDSQQVSLLCPLGKVKMQFPCRSENCRHLQCFDAGIFLRMNEKSPRWTCPICNSDAGFRSLFLDGYFMDVLQSRLLGKDDCEIILEGDGGWRKKEQDKAGGEVDSVETILEEDDDDILIVDELETISQEEEDDDDEDALIIDLREDERAEADGCDHVCCMCDAI